MSKGTIVWIIVAILFVVLMIIVWSKNKAQDEAMKKPKPMAFQSVTGHVNVNPVLATSGRG